MHYHLPDGSEVDAAHAGGVFTAWGDAGCSIEVTSSAVLDVPAWIAYDVIIDAGKWTVRAEDRTMDDAIHWATHYAALRLAAQRNQPEDSNISE